MLLDRLKATGRIFALFLGVFALSTAAQAGPEDGRIVNGSGSISQSGTHTDIHQNSDFLATHWGSFNIAAHESVQAHQPRSTSRLLIRVDGGAATNIAGSYTSNGITILENRNGVQFSRGAIVNVGGLLATSSRISGADGAHWQLNGTGGAVVNHGQIVAGAGGAILAAVKVQNTGDIISKGGDVALGAGSSFTVDFAGSMVGFEVSQAASGASITNTGKIEAQGGVVALSAQEAQAVRTNVVSVGGVVKATRIERRGGVVYLSGGDEGIAEVSGAVSASDKVQTTGEYVVVKEGAVLRAPEILVGGDLQGRDGVQTAKRTLVEAGALLDAGAEGRVIVWSDDVTWFNGDITAPGGFAEVSGKQTLASVNLAGIAVGELLLDPEDIIIAASGTGDAVTESIAADAEGMTLTLDVATINSFEGALTLAASNTITVNAPINKQTGRLRLTAGGDLTITADIDNGANRLILTAGFESGTGDLVACTTCTLTASDLRLRQDGAFADTRPYIISTAVFSLRTSASQTVHGWMTELASRAFSLTSGGDITINNDIVTTGFFGTITLAAFGERGVENRIVLGNHVRIATERTSISLVGTIDGSAGNYNLTIDSASALSLPPGGINLGDGVLMIKTGSSLPIGFTTVSENIPFIASSISIEFTSVATTTVVQGFGGETIFNTITFSTAPTFTLAPRTCSQTPTCTISSSAGITSLEVEEQLIAGNSITIDAGALPLVFVGTGAIMIRAPTVSITASAIDIGDRALTIMAENGSLTLGTSVTTTGDITLSSMGTNAGIMLDSNITLSGAAVSFTGAIASTSNNLTITTTDRLTLNSNIDIGTGVLDITAGERINVPNSDTDITAMTIMVTFTASDVPNEEDGFTIDGTPTLINANFTPTPTFLSLNVLSCTEAICVLGTGDEAVVAGPLLSAMTSIEINAGPHALTFEGRSDISIMAPTVEIIAGSIDIGARNLTITANGGTLTLSTDINGTGNITLDSATIALTASTTTLTGAVINLTGVINETTTDARNLTINASGILTLNSNITLPAGASNGRLEITASRVDIPSAIALLPSRLRVVFSDPSVVSFETGFMGAGVEGSTFAENRIYTYAPRDCGGEDICSLTSIDNEGFLLSPMLTARERITIAARGDVLTFSGTSNISITAPIVSIQANAINIGNRSLTITANGGTLTLGTAITTTGNITLSSTGMNAGIILIFDTELVGRDIRLTGAIDEPSGATNSFVARASGRLTLNDNIDVGTNSLILTGRDVTRLTQGDNIRVIASPGIILGGSIMLTGGAVTLTGAIDESGGGGSDSLTIMASGTLTLALNNNTDRGVNIINLGAGDLILDAARIDLTGSRITWTGRVITIGGRISKGDGTRSELTVMAGGILTLNSNISVSSSISSLNLTGSTIRLGNDITLNAIGNLTLTGAINESGGNGNDDLTLTSTSLRLNSNINLGTGDLTVEVEQNVTLGNPITLTASAITFEFAVGRAGNLEGNGNNLTLRPSGRLTIDDTINLGAGVLTIVAGERINADRTLSFIASAINIEFTDSTATSRELGFTIGSTPTLGNVTFSQAVNYGFPAVPGTGCGEMTACLLTNGVISNVLSADTSIELRFGTNAISFGGTDEITITSPVVTITAAALNLNGRSLIITSDGGTLTLNLNADITNANMITIGAADKALTLTSTGVRSLAAENINFFSSADSVAFNQSLQLLSTAALTTNTGISVSGAGNALTLGAAGVMRVTQADASRTFLSQLGNVTLNAQITNVVEDNTIPFFGIEVAANANDTQTLFINAGADIQGTTPGNVVFRARGGEIGSNTLIKSTGQITLEGQFTAPTNANLMLDAGGTLSLTGDVSINLGMGDLILIGTVGVEFTTNGGDFTARNITLTGVINNNTATQALDFTATDTLTLNSNITFPQAVGFLGGGTLALGGPITIMAESFSMVQNVTVASAGNNNLFITTTAGNISLTGDSINLGTGNLNLNSRASNILLGADITLTGGAITLTGAINEAADDTSSLTITAMGVLRLNSDINTGMGDLTLTGGTGGIVLGGDITLIGAAISLTGAINESAASANAQGRGGRDSLTITASNVLTLGSSINLGTEGASTLTITAERISAASITLTAANPISIEFTGANIISAAQGFTVNGAATLNMVTFSPTAVVYRFPPLICPSMGACELGNGMMPLMLAAMLSAATSLTIDAGGNVITFAGMGPIRIEAETIMITASRLSIENGRALTIIAGDGALTLNANIRTAMPSAITLTATGGVLMLGGGISGTSSMPTTGDITLTGTDVRGGGDVLTTAGIQLGKGITLNGAAISLSGSIAEADASTDNLTITASGVLTLNNDIALGAGALTLTGGGTGGIALGSPITLTGAAITLTGPMITGTNAFTVDASGVLTLNGNINIGTTAALSLTVGTGAITGAVGGSVPMLTAGTVSLDQVVTFAEDAPFTFGSATSSLTLATGADQIVRNAWMVVEDRALILTAAGAITASANIAIGAGSLTLVGARIALDGTITGTGEGTPSMLQQTAADFLSHVSLTSTTGAITISQSITTTGDIILDGAGGIDFITNAIMLTGSNITLTGVATSALGLTFKAVENYSEVQLLDSFATNPPGFLGREVITRDNGDVVINNPLTVSSGNLSIEADGDITINNLTATTGTITLTAGFGSDVIELGLGAIYSGSIGEEGVIAGFALRMDASKTGNIMAVGGGTPALTAGTVSLTQDGEFDAAFAGPSGMFTLTVSSALNLTTNAAQTVHGWMISGNRFLNLTSTGASISLGTAPIDVGTGDLTLTAPTISLGGVVSLVGRQC